jgi:UDP-N-acetylglucosamine 2-epimerase (non-hydrolysing)
MRILTVLGTRPEIIRLSRVIPALDACTDHRVLHTGQNADPRLNDVFFADLGVRAPDHTLSVQTARFGSQVARILEGVEQVMLDWRPDALLVLGDTNSGLSALVAKRLAVPVCHMEAGNRCYDDRVPEEVNRRVIDHSSDVLMPYTERSRQNLLREGIPGERIFVTGNPIYEVLQHHAQAIDAADPFTACGVTKGRYLLVTLHRAENVDVEPRLRSLAAALEQLQAEHGVPVIVSTHPRTRSFLERYGVSIANRQIVMAPPFGFLDFVALERHALCVLTDSGTVQEETAIFGVPNVTARDVTERPETLECGSNLLAGCDPGRLVAAVRAALAYRQGWTPPREYVARNVSETVARIVLSMSWKRECG